MENEYYFINITKDFKNMLNDCGGIKWHIIKFQKS